MTSIVTYLCEHCGSTYPISELLYDCPRCNGFLDVHFELEDPRFIVDKAVSSMWRYPTFLPIQQQHIVSLGEGGTPLLRASRLSAKFGSPNIFLKNESVCPSGSFKDRGASVLLSKAKEVKARSVTIDSSGNAAASIAAYAAKGGLQCYVFAPAYASGSKLVQAAAYGATVVKVQGTRKDVYDVARLAHQKFGGCYCGFQSNSFAIQGLKTIAYEISEWFNWRGPNRVVFSVGTGSALIGCWKGFTELMDIGMIETVPSLVCIQPDGCAPISQAYKQGLTDALPVPTPKTIAEGLMIGYPIRGKQVLKAIQDTQGICDTVSDEEIITAVKLLGKYEGLFVEPSSAAMLAGLFKLFTQGMIDRDETIVCVVTGTGLKASTSYSNLFKETLQIRPREEDLNDLQKFLRQP